MKSPSTLRSCIEGCPQSFTKHFEKIDARLLDAPISKKLHHWISVHLALTPEGQPTGTLELARELIERALHITTKESEAEAADVGCLDVTNTNSESYEWQFMKLDSYRD